MLRSVKSIGQLPANLRLQTFEESLIEFRRRHLAFRLANLAPQFVDGGADLFDFGVGEFNGVHDRLFLYFFRAGLDHDNRIGSAYDHDVEQAVAHFGVCGIGDEAAIHEADTNGADGAEKRNVGEGQSGRSGVNAADIGIVFRIGGGDEGDDPRLIFASLGEHRTNRPINLTAGENLALAHAPLALYKAAWGASAGVGVLAVIDGEGKEVDAGAGFGIRGGGGKG